MSRLDDMAAEYIIDLFSASSTIRSKSGVRWYSRGFEHMRAGEYEKAVRCFTRAIDTHPGYTEAYFNRGNAYIYLSQFDDAIEDFNMALRIDPEYADAQYCLGFTCFLKGDINGAKAGFRRSSELGSERARAKLEGLRQGE